MNTSKNGYEVIDIIETVAIIFKDGEKKLFDAIQIKSKKGVITGNIIEEDKHYLNTVLKKVNLVKKIKKIDSHRVFIETGYIPLRQIDHIELGAEKKILKKNY